MYFSKEQIELSIQRLDELHPFFGMTFLAFKQAMLPMESTRSINTTGVLKSFLQKYYQPAPRFAGYYTPFDTYNKRQKRWNSGESYQNTLLTTAARQFSDVVIHPKNGSLWGWQGNYINAMSKHLGYRLIPAFDLAVWLFHSHFWGEQVQPDDIINTFFQEFHITADEQVLFDRNPPFLANPWLQEYQLTPDELLDIIGPPPDSSIEGVTLQMLKLRGVGPVEREIDFVPSARLNLITGDNGLGKSFLLECAWWALTGQWAGYPAYPNDKASRDSSAITFQIGKNRKRGAEQTVRFDWNQLDWEMPAKGDILPGLSIFARFDGSFTVWDPAKYLLAREERYSRHGRGGSISFSRLSLLEGIKDPGQYANGLITDWIRWQDAKNQDPFNKLTAALKGLSPKSSREILVPGKTMRMLEPGGGREMPTLHFDYGDVPILLCSAGVQRIVSLAYLLVWAWQEHLSVAQSMRREPERSITLLIDEVEAHLHPLWQRSIVPSLMNVVKELAPEVRVQLIVTTHSPLILASVETEFDEEQDALFHLDEKNGIVQLKQEPFIRRGRVDKWLMSDAFGLEQPRSIEAEKAIEAAKELQVKERESSHKVTKEEVQRVSNMLLNSLADDDDFWPRWTYFAEQRGVNL